MFKDEFEKLVNASKAKSGLLEKNPMGYFLSACLAGMYVGFGIILIFTIGGFLKDQPYQKIAMGASFGVALSLVLMAGSELFTGNNLIMTAGSLKKEVSWAKTFKLWVVCFLGNWAGSVVLAVMYKLSGLGNVEAVANFFAKVAHTKTSLPVSEMFFRGILCNILVCLAVWCFFKLQSESAKLIMIFWCLFAFITSGFEHSIANMTALTIGIMNPMDQVITLSGYLTNIFVVTAGNMVGAILFLVLPYYVISKDKK